MIALGIPVWIRSVIVKAGFTKIGLVINAFKTIFIETLQLKRFYGSLPSKLITLKLLALWLWKSSTTCCCGRKSTQTSFQASAVEKNSHMRLNLGLECEAEKNGGKKRPHSSAKLNLPHPLPPPPLSLALSSLRTHKGGVRVVTGGDVVACEGRCRSSLEERARLSPTCALRVKQRPSLRGYFVVPVTQVWLRLPEDVLAHVHRLVVAPFSVKKIRLRMF